MPLPPALALPHGGPSSTAVIFCIRRVFMRPVLVAIAHAAAALAAVAGDACPVADDPPRSLIAAVNAVVASDIAISAAEALPCPLASLPGTRAALLPLLPSDHRDLIAECARGRVRMRRQVLGFDLLSLIELALIEDPAAGVEDATTIRRFFADRPVDVAVGRACSAGPYPIAFDWAVVLDPRSRTIFSFVLNCRD